MTLTFGSYAYLMRLIMIGRVRLYPLTWFLWSLVGFTVYLAQYMNDAGQGADASLFSGLCLLIIGFLSALKGGAIQWQPKDRFIFFACLIAMLFWVFLEDAIYGVIILVFVEVAAFLPTFLKGIRYPYSESSLYFFLSGMKYLISLYLLQVFSLTNAIFPLAAACCYLTFSVLLFILQKKSERVTSC